MYYSDKISSLKDLFACDNITLTEDSLLVGAITYPIINDVIILLPDSKLPAAMKKCAYSDQDETYFSQEIQYSFGEEWKTFSDISSDHERIFRQYFDLVELSSLSDHRVCDLGCGIGRWSYFLVNKCRELILLDFSEAIFVARNNLRNANNVIFFMGDINELPFKDNFADLIFSLGVLHHLPNNALDVIRNLHKYAPKLLIYLYYALDNRPIYFKALLAFVTKSRKLLFRIRNPLFRMFFTFMVALLVYKPMVCLGMILKPFGLARHIPLYEGYRGMSFRGIRQDVYDRFFTSIEQRFTKKEIALLEDSFSEIIISSELPYWHFLCKR